MGMEKKPPNLYDSPFYYDVAFGFRDISKEVDFSRMHQKVLEN